MELMKRKQIFLLFSLFMLIAFCRCSDDDENVYRPDISIPGTSDVIETINENEEWVIPVQISSDNGIKRASYFLVTTSGSELVPGDAVTLPISGNEVKTDIKIKVPYNLHSVIISVVDGKNNISKRVIDVQSVKRIAVLAFKGDVDYRDVVCVGIPFTIKGNVNSEWELKEFTYQTLVNGTAGNSTPIDLGNKKEISFASQIPVASGLSGVIFKAVNIHGGVTLDTFKVNNVVTEDFISITMNGDITELTSVFDSEDNPISGTIASGSDIKSLKHAITTNGTEGALQTVNIDEDAGNDADFTFSFKGTENMTQVRLVAENTGGKTISLNLAIPKVLVRATYFKNVIITSDPNGNDCFFAAYMEPHVFGRSVALQNQSKIDFVFYKTGAGAQTLSPHAFGANATILANSAAYLKDFTQLTYMLLTSRRGNITKNDFDQVISEDDLSSLTTNPAKNGYSVSTPGTGIAIANRRIGDTFTTASVPGAFICGWGARSEESVTPAFIQNKSYGVGWVNEVKLLENGYIQLNFDIKVPRADQRSLYNSESMVTRSTPLP